MITIREQSDVFCDGFVGHQYGILFASVWGRSSSLLQFLSRMELPIHEDGINSLSFNVPEGVISGDAFYPLQHSSNLKTLTGRVHNTIYGHDLSHIFIYDISTTAIDYSNHQATIIYTDNELSTEAVWSLLQAVSPIPLLNNKKWCGTVIRYCQDNDYITNISGYGNVNALVIKLEASSFEKAISQMIKQQQLTLN